MTISAFTKLFMKNLKLLMKRRNLRQEAFDCAVFTSASTVKGFVEAVPELDYSRVKAAVSENRQKQQQINIPWKLTCQKKRLLTAF